MKNVAIVKDSGCIEPIWCTHWAILCGENNIPYRIFNSYAPDFMAEIQRYCPDKVLWRSGHMLGAKEKDAFQRTFLEDEARLKIIPDWNLHRFYDNKVLQTYLFQKENIPHPETVIFYDKQSAEKHIMTCEYPFVVKSNAGAGSGGTRFCFNHDEAIKQVNECFGNGIEYSKGIRESGLMYKQRYIKADGIFRIVMIGDSIGYSFYQSNRPGTLVASSQGFDSYPDTPPELLFLSHKISRLTKWQYCMYDWIYDELNKKWLVLEITDTCGQGHSKNRKYTYYLNDGQWEAREENTTPQELIFRHLILAA